MLKKTLSFWGLMLFVLLLSVGEVNASELNISVQAGFEGKCKLGGVNPIEVLLDIKEEELKGDLIIDANGKIYSHPVTLERNTKKHFKFSIPIFKADELLEVRFETDGNIIAKKSVSLQVLPVNSIFIGVLSETPVDLFYLKDLDFEIFRNKTVQVLELNKKLDYSLNELDNFNIIVLDNFNTATLSQESERLLNYWISKGNIIVIGANKYAYKNLTGMFVGLKGVKQLGNGYILPIEKDLENSDCESIQELIENYLTPLGISKVVQNNQLQKQISEAKSLFGVADYLLKPTYNTAFFLISILSIYLIFLGTAMFLGKRYKGIFSVIVLLFCLLFYGVASWDGFQKSKAAGANINIYNNGAISYGLTNIYSYKNAVTSINLPEDSFFDGINAEKYEIDSIERKIIYQEQATHYLFNNKASSEQIPLSKININQDSIIQGEITNPLPYKMYNCFLIIGDTVINIGDLQGKEKASIKYKLDYNLRNQGDYNYLANINKAANLDMYQKKMLEYYFYNINDFSLSGKLLGFSKEKAKMKINNKEIDKRQIALNIFDVQLEAAEDNVYLPCGLIKPVVDYCQSKESEERREYILKKGQALKVYYQIPKYIEVKEINVFTKVDFGEISLEVFNKKENEWEPLVSTILTGDNLTKYISQGPLVLKMEGDSRVIIPEIAVSGVIKAR